MEAAVYPCRQEADSNGDAQMREEEEASGGSGL